MPLRQGMAGQRRVPAIDDPRSSPMRQPRGYFLDHGDHQFHRSGSPLAMNADIDRQADRRPAPGRAPNYYQEHDVESPRFDHLRLRRSYAVPPIAGIGDMATGFMPQGVIRSSKQAPPLAAGGRPPTGPNRPTTPWAPTGRGGSSRPR